MGNFGNDLVTGFDTGSNDNLVTELTRHLDRLHLDLVRIIDQIDKAAFLTGLHRSLGQHHRIRFDCQNDAYVYKLTRPDDFLRVINPGFQQHGARLGGHRVIHKDQLAGSNRRTRAIRKDLDAHIFLTLVSSDLFQLTFRNTECNQDRIRAVDRHQRDATA